MRRLTTRHCQSKAERAMIRLSPIAPLLVGATLLLAAACSPPQPAERPPLEGARIGGAFTLVGEGNRAVSDTDFAGQYRLIYFGFTNCPDVCPVDLNSLMLGLQQFERHDAGRARSVQPIMITVDPERDTPQAMATYVRNFHPRLIGLSGTPEQIADVARKYVVNYMKQEGSTPDQYIVGHTQLAYLMGPAGEPLALIPVDDVRTADVNEGSPDIVAAELDRWVR
jgi:protein SCO1